MNIAFFSKHLPSDEPNGVSVQVHRLAEALSERKHSITVFTFSQPVDGAAYKTVVIQSPKRASVLGRKFAPAIAFRRVDTSSFDIVHYHGDDYFCKGSLRRVRTFYGSALREALHAATMGRRCYQALFYLFEIVSSVKKGRTVAISEATRNYIPRVGSVIPCSVPLSRFTPGTEKTAYPSILFLGDFESRKRGVVLLDIFEKKILPQWPDAMLTVVGPVPCSGEGIVYAGRVGESQLIREYQKSWLFCMPSSYEGFGVPIIEAFACKTAVVAVRTSGSEAIVTDGIDGLLCSEATIASTIHCLFADADLRKNVAARALTTVCRYDSRVIAEAYENLYQSIMDSIQK